MTEDDIPRAESQSIASSVDEDEPPAESTMKRKRAAELELRDAIIEAVPVNRDGRAAPVHDRIYDAIMDDEIEWALRELVCNEGTETDHGPK